MKTLTKLAVLLLVAFCLFAKKTKAINQDKLRRSSQPSQQDSGAIDSETISINAEARVPKKNRPEVSQESFGSEGGKGRKIRRRKANPAPTAAKIDDNENLRIDPVGEQNHPHYYNFYVFSVQWARGICSTKKCPYNTNRGKYFNIHGLWPSSTRKRGPSDCFSSSLNWKSVDASLRSDLDTHWAGLFASAKQFNAHEWRKHGTCMDPFHGSLDKMPPLISPLIKSWRELRSARLMAKKKQENYVRSKVDDYQHNLYFKTAIALNKILDLKETLKKNGIRPSPKSLEVSKFKQAITDAYKVKNFGIRCLRGRRNRRGEYYIAEIRFCYDFNFRMINCAKKFSTNCGDTVFLK